jgi:hypothetical protein
MSSAPRLHGAGDFTPGSCRSPAAAFFFTGPLFENRLKRGAMVRHEEESL